MPEGLTFNADGTATVAWDSYSVTLRRPKLREYRSFLEEQEAARASLNDKITTNEDGEQVLRDLDIIGTDDEPGVYPKLWLRVMRELGDAQLDEGLNEGDLPVWMGPGATFGELVTNWRKNPLAPGATPTPS